MEVLRAVAPQGCRVANGIAFTGDGKQMYFVDSPTRTVQCIAYSDENLEAINLRCAQLIAWLHTYRPGLVLETVDKLTS